MSLIQTEIKNNVAIIRLNRPEKRNALSPELISSLLEKFKSFEADDKVKVVIITGNGKAFCAGVDLEYLNLLRENDTSANEKDSVLLSDFFFGVYNFTKPLIAAVNGHAIAGGCGLATACDFIIANPSAKFGYTETKIGFLPAIVSYILLKRISAAKAIQLLLTANLISADVALSIGLIDEIHDAPMNKAFEIAEKISQNSLWSLIQTKKMIKEISSMKEVSAKNYLKNLNVISRTSSDFKAGLEKFFNSKGDKE